MTVAEFKADAEKRITEKDWQAQVTAFAKHRGWNTYHTWRSIHSAAGFPDLCMVRSLPNGDRRIIFAELKRVGKQPSENQRAWLEGLSQVAEMCDGHVEVYCWNPSQWLEVKERLM